MPLGISLSAMFDNHSIQAFHDRMSRTAPMLVALLVSAATVDARAECTCRFPGGSVKEGQSVCIKTPNGPKLARCEKVQNVTSWKFLEQSCPITQSLRSKIQPKRT
jgi:hypothetical protein